MDQYKDYELCTINVERPVSAGQTCDQLVIETSRTTRPRSAIDCCELYSRQKDENIFFVFVGNHPNSLYNGYKFVIN